MSAKGPKKPKLHKDKKHAREFDPAAKYREFQKDDDHGQGAGFDTWVWINNPALFRDPATVPDEQQSAALKAFLDAGRNDAGRNTVRYYFAQFKSSHVAAEFFIHSPVDAMTDGALPKEIDARALADEDIERVHTLVMNHEATLAHHSIRTMAAVDDKGSAGVVVTKEEEGGS